MKHVLKTTALAAAIATGIGIGAVAPWESGNGDSKRTVAHAAPLDVAMNGTLSDVAAKATPSVVNVASTREVDRRKTPLFNHPFFRQRDPRERDARSLGSGVIVSDAGYVLTSSHVVEGADKVRVGVHDGREFDAEIVGTDPKSDVAVLKLQGDISNLQPIELGDSGSLNLGEPVLAIGNPFGVGQTVTMGIVSATGRANVGIVDYENFIQTDAAINPGNSGGALVDMNGRLVGINTAILSRSGGYQGIGFAIPVDMARPIMKQLVERGRVVRGWLGVQIQELEGELASALGIDVEDGVLVADVVEGSPADEAGLQREDVIVSVDGTRVNSTGELRNLIASSGANAQVELGVVRNGNRTTLAATLDELESARQAANGGGGSSSEALGARVTGLSDEVRATYDLPEDLDHGAVVTDVGRGGLAAQVGLQPGDVILEVNRREVASPRELDQALERAGRRLALLVYRDGRTIYLAVSR